MAPCVFLVRHGETEWSKLGKYTGTTEKGLTEHGREEARAVADGFVGHGRLIDPASLLHVLVSPRHRARETFELMMSNIAEASYNLTVCEDVREWEHGLYEGMTTQEIRALRAGQGLDEQKEWSIWTGGCEGGESVLDITNRVKKVMALIHEIHEARMNSLEPANILIVGHGTFLRCLIKVWGGLGVESPLDISLETGSVATLSYKDRDINKRTVVIGQRAPHQ